MAVVYLSTFYRYLTDTSAIRFRYYMSGIDRMSILKRSSFDWCSPRNRPSIGPYSTAISIECRYTWFLNSRIQVTWQVRKYSEVLSSELDWTCWACNQSTTHFHAHWWKVVYGLKHTQTFALLKDARLSRTEILEMWTWQQHECRESSFLVGDTGESTSWKWKI